MSSDAAVLHHRSRIAQVAEATSSAVIITDTAGVIVWVNEGFTRITGYAFDEAVGRVPGQLLQGPETDREEAARIGAALRSQQSVSAELINYTKDGRRYRVGMKIEMLFDPDGELDGFMAIEADITDRHERNEAITQLTHRFTVATRAARIGVYERESDGEHVWWNDLMWEIFGQDPATFVLTMESWLGLIHPEDSRRIREMTRSPTVGQATTVLQYRIIRPDGETRHVRLVRAPAEPNVNRIAGIAFDVTDRILADERERELQKQLREQAHQAGMAEIATGILHNVGNVLNSLGIANNTARRDLKSLRLERLQQATELLISNRTTLESFLTDHERGRHLPEYLKALSAQIASNVRAVQAELDTSEHLLEHLSDIVNAQQELARVGGRCESISLRDLVETALLVQASDLAQIELVREFEDLPSIMTDRHKLLQILVNLLTNARDAVHIGMTDRCRILVKLAREGDRVAITIEDTGIGMSEEVLSQLWRFGFTTKEKGHGFGLHNSANAAHEIGATLTAHSDGVGRGSRFILRLPIENSQTMLSGVAA